MNSIFKKTAIAGAFALAFVVAPQAGAEEVATKGGLEVKSDDGLYKFKFGGRIQADADLFDDEKDVGAHALANKPLDFASGTEIRRARFEVNATVNKDWLGKLEVDFRDGGGTASDTRLRDAFVGYNGFEYGSIRLGQFKTPYGLEHLTSDLFTTFVERSLIFNGFTTSAEYLRAIGFNGARGNATYFVDLYDSGNRDAGTDHSGDPGLAARFTYTPIKDKVQIVHLGVNGGREFNKGAVGATCSGTTSNCTGLLTVKPEANLADAIMLTRRDAVIADKVNIDRLGAEAAWVRGPFTLQSEYMKYKISGDRDKTPVVVGAPSVGKSEDFSSYYAYVSWFITGETRPYKASTGTWDRIVPLDPQKGAWEVALRYSTIKDDDSDAKVNDITLGTNYYWNSQVRLMANVIQTDASNIYATNSAGTSATVNTVGQKYSGKPKSLLFRIQYDF